MCGRSAAEIPGPRSSIVIVTESRVPSARTASHFVPDRELDDGERLVLAGPEHTQTLRVLHTPGHAANHLCLVMEEDGLLDNAARVGAHLKARLQESLGGVQGVKEVRGYGLMIGIELDRPCGAIMTQALEAGLLLSVTADSVIRLVPPLIITPAEADEIVSILVPIIQQFLAAA